MAKKPERSDPFKGMEAGFMAMTDGWAEVGQRRLTAQGQIGIGDVWSTTKALLHNTVKRLFAALRKMLSHLDPVGAAQAVGGFVAAGVESMIGAATELINGMLEVADTATDAAVEILLGMIEAVKKAIHLILDGIKLPQVTQPVELL